MKQLFLVFFISFFLCLSTRGQNNNENTNVKNGYSKYQSKHNFSFYYSKIWTQLDKVLYESLIKASYKELEPLTDYEAGFTLKNDKNEFIFPRFTLETNSTPPPSMEELKKQLIDFDLAKVFEDEKKETWNNNLDKQLSMLSSNKPTLDEKKYVVYFVSVLKMQGQSDLYCLSVLFLGKNSIVSIKFFLPLLEKEKYLKTVSETIESFKFDKEFEYKN